MTEFPETMDDDLQDVLSVMVWQSGKICKILRAGGQEIPRKTEAEQAHVLFWLIHLYLKHGKDWHARSVDQIQAIIDKVKEDNPA